MLVVTISSLIQTIMAKLSVISAGGADMGWAILQAVIALVLIFLAVILALDSVVTLKNQSKK
jgi:carbon starvation protein